MGNYFTELDRASKITAGRGKCPDFQNSMQVLAIKFYLNQKKIQTNHAYSIDIICYGTPNQILWEDYRKWLEEKNGSNLVDFSFRYKGAGWKLYPSMAEFANGKKKVNT